MKKILSSLKGITFELLPVLLLIVLVLTYSQNSDPTFSRNYIFAEVSQGKYHNVDKLLKENSTLKNISYDQKTGHPDFKSEQLLEMIELTTEMATSYPFNGLVYSIKNALNNPLIQLKKI